VEDAHHVSTRDAMPDFDPRDFARQQWNAATELFEPEFPGCRVDITGVLRQVQAARPRWLILARDEGDFCCRPEEGGQCPTPEYTFCEFPVTVRPRTKLDKTPGGAGGQRGRRQAAADLRADAPACTGDAFYMEGGAIKLCPGLRALAHRGDRERRGHLQGRAGRRAAPGAGRQGPRQVPEDAPAPTSSPVRTPPLPRNTPSPNRSSQRRPAGRPSATLEERCSPTAAGSPLPAALAALAMVPSAARAGDFVDTRVTLLFTDDNVLVKPGETTPSNPGARFGFATAPTRSSTTTSTPSTPGSRR
jgi:hypothetical protein